MRLGRQAATRFTIRVLLAALTAGGLATRLLWLGRRAPHNDEALQLNGIQTTTWDQLIAHCTHVDMHPPLSYLVQKVFWLTGHDLWRARLPSALLGTACIPLTYWALRPLTGRLTALAAAAVTMASYHLIWYSREVRDYIFFYFFIVVAFGCLVRVLRSGRPRAAWPWLTGLALANVGAVYSHFNTYLVWPVFGLLVIVDESRRRGWRHWRRWRWRLLGALAAAAAVVVLAAAPTFRWFQSMYHVQQGASLRPGASTLLEYMGGFGLGGGWREGVWLVWFAIGAVALWRRPQALLWTGIWIFVPLVAYVYLVGMPMKFLNGITRYQITLALGFAALSGAAGAWAARVLAPQRAVRHMCVLAAVLPTLAFATALAPDFVNFYRLRATAILYGDIWRTFESLGDRALLLRNYYDIQYLRHGIPPRMRVAAPAVFNNDAEYAALHIPSYVRQALETSPGMAYYDGGVSSNSAAAWAWCATHFVHRRVFANNVGAALERRGLNLFAWPSNLTGAWPFVYWNDRDELPAWYARRGRTACITIGPEWYVVPCFMGGAMHAPLPVLAGSGGTLLVCNAGTTDVAVKVTLQLASCAAGQILRYRAPGGITGFIGPFGAPATVRDLRNGQVQQGFLPLGALCQQTGGLLQLPLECAFQPQTVHLELPACPPGVTTVELTLSHPEGIALLGIDAQAAAPGG